MEIKVQLLSLPLAHLHGKQLAAMDYDHTCRHGAGVNPDPAMTV